MKWESNITFAPKYRRQVIYGKIKQDIGQMLSKLREYKEIIEAEACNRQYIRNQLQEGYTDDQMSIKEYIDPFTGQPVKEGK